MVDEYRNGDYMISTDKKRLKTVVIHAFLRQSYWGSNMTFDSVKKSIKNSFCFGMYKNEEQVGFARVVTDHTTFAYLADVFILENHRGEGLSKWLVETVMSHPELQNLRRWLLITKDAHGLYKKFGFKGINNPDEYLEIFNPDI